MTRTAPKVRLQYFDGCPGWQTAAARLEAVLAEAGAAGAEIEYERIESAEQAEAAGFHGSPTVLIDGVDPFADPDSPIGLACRIYRTPEGMAPAPTLEQLREAFGV